MFFLNSLLNENSNLSMLRLIVFLCLNFYAPIRHSSFFHGIQVCMYFVL